MPLKDHSVIRCTWHNAALPGAAIPPVTGLGADNCASLGDGFYRRKFRSVVIGVNRGSSGAVARADSQPRDV